MEYGPQFDSALHVLLWELLSKLEKLLPVPDLKQVFFVSIQMCQNVFNCKSRADHNLCFQTVAWLGSAPSLLEKCVQSSPEELGLTFKHYKSSGLLKMPCE